MGFVSLLLVLCAAFRPFQCKEPNSVAHYGFDMPYASTISGSRCQTEEHAHARQPATEAVLCAFLMPSLPSRGPERFQGSKQRHAQWRIHRVPCPAQGRLPWPAHARPGLPGRRALPGAKAQGELLQCAVGMSLSLHHADEMLIQPESSHRARIQ